MGFLHRVKVLFGLADEYDEYEDDEYYNPDDEEPEGRPEPAYRSPYSSETSVRRISREPDLERAREVAATRSSMEHPADRPQVKMHIAEPKSFSEAQQIADRFREGTPVIMNLTGTDPDLSKRLIDFASGLTYGLNGGLKKVSDKVFMLTPANVDVSAEDRRRLRDKGLFTLDS